MGTNFIIVTDVLEGKSYADKVINKALFVRKENARQKVMREINIHRRMSHKNIVEFCGRF